MPYQLVLASGEEIALIAVGGGLLVAIISIIAGVTQRTIATKQREQSRREIAAYVAEGSITPDDAAKLLADGKSVSGCGAGRARV